MKSLCQLSTTRPRVFGSFDFPSSIANVLQHAMKRCTLLATKQVLVAMAISTCDYKRYFHAFASQLETLKVIQKF